MTLQWAAFPNPAAVSTVIIGPPGQGTVNWTPGSTTATVTGLGCQAYTFTIASKGPGGTSAAATFPVAWGCQAPGSGPTNVQVTPSIDATWLVVSWAGVPGATSYDVTATIRTNVQGYQPDSSNHLVSVAGNQTSATVIGLYMGQVYGITVTARNGQGSAASASVSGITGWGPGSSARSVTIDMSSYTNIRACNPSATSGSTMCNAWLMKSPNLWVNNNQPPPLGNEYTALNQHSSISVVCGKQGAKVLGTGGANAATWLLTAGNGYVGWLSDGWIVGAGSTVASLPTCNF